MDTVIVDEAGCVPESATPMLLRLAPANLVLIGDHKQLQAFTALVDPPRNHCRRAALQLRAEAAGPGRPGATLPRASATNEPQSCPAPSCPAGA